MTTRFNHFVPFKESFAFLSRRGDVFRRDKGEGEGDGDCDGKGGGDGEEGEEDCDSGDSASESQGYNYFGLKVEDKKRGAKKRGRTRFELSSRFHCPAI